MLKSMSHHMTGVQLPNNVNRTFHNTYHQRVTSSILQQAREQMRYHILKYVQEKAIFSCQEEDIHRIIKLLDDKIFMESSSKEEYMDLNTLAHRLDGIIMLFLQAFYTEPATSRASSGLLPINANVRMEHLQGQLNDYIAYGKNYDQPLEDVMGQNIGLSTASTIPIDGDVSRVMDPRYYVSGDNVSTNFLHSDQSYKQFNSYNHLSYTMDPPRGLFVSYPTSQQAYQLQSSPLMHQQFLRRQQPSAQSNMSGIINAETESHTGSTSEDKRKRQRDETNFLILYRHTVACLGQQKVCKDVRCRNLKLLLEHMKTCYGSCELGCNSYRAMVDHYNSCFSNFQVCDPLSKIITERQLCNSGVEHLNGYAQRPLNDANLPFSASYSFLNDKIASPKRLKTEHQSFSCFPWGKDSQVILPMESISDPVTKYLLEEHFDVNKSMASRMGNVEMESKLSASSPSQVFEMFDVAGSNSIDVIDKAKTDVQSAIPSVIGGQCAEENAQFQMGIDKNVQKETEPIVAPSKDHAAESKFIGVLSKAESDVQSAIPSVIGGQCAEENVQFQIEVDKTIQKETEPIMAPSEDHASESKFIGALSKVECDVHSAIPSVIDGQCAEENVQFQMEVDKTVQKETEPIMAPSEDHASESKFVGALSEVKSDVQSVLPDGKHYLPQNMQVQIEAGMIEMELKDSIATLSENAASETMLAKPKIKGLSLIEWFTADQVKKHLRSIKQTANQGERNAEQNEKVQLPFDENTCQLCGLSNLYFEPPAIFCALCGGCIVRNRAYYTMAVNDTLVDGGSIETYFCNPCYNGNRVIKYAGSAIQKTRLVKKRNDECDIEPWVQCDKCAAWQHQICCLFNDIQNERDKTEYTCPNCYIRDLKNGDCVPLPEKMLLGAENLPKSKLSEHIEKRLIMRLKQEREERAKKFEKHFDEVPGAEGLIVRVVSSIDNNLEVKKVFHTIFEKDNYPKDFPYKSKAILLFQKIDGADICIFAMYVQEYGSDCPLPNQRHVHISYLDSVKYFCPEIKAVTGEALRTIVYHEILIGYLDYCKIRGFACCYIWSCPSVKREDFILNCHPEKQKMPKYDKLREWYRAMLLKAIKENIVVHTTNLYDYFLMPANECKVRISAARLPYFDGDYWPSKAEEILNAIKQEEEGGEPKNRGKMNVTRRGLKALRHGTSTGTSKDILLMHKLGEAILPRKDDFILIHLQHTCNHCCKPIITGKRWVCSCCQRYHLCDRCHDVEEKLDGNNKHAINLREKHSFSPVEVTVGPLDTTDEDDNVQSEIFDSRMKFLNFCQGGHYQFDTLRRAKHSTMMILYQHHSAAAPVSVTSFSTCHDDIKTGQSWHHDAVEIRPKISWEMQLLELMKHAAECLAARCAYFGCRSLKLLFRHGVNCKVRHNGGCTACKKMWGLMKLHSRSCDKLVCRVPRCLDMRNRVKQLKEKESQPDFHGKSAAMERGRKEDMVS